MMIIKTWNSFNTWKKFKGVDILPPVIIKDRTYNNSLKLLNCLYTLYIQNIYICVKPNHKPYINSCFIYNR